MNGGAVNAAVASAAVLMNCRRVVFKRFIGIPPLLWNQERTIQAMPVDSPLQGTNAKTFVLRTVLPPRGGLPLVEVVRPHPRNRGARPRLQGIREVDGR